MGNRTLARERAAYRELVADIRCSRGVSAYCEWQERRTAPLVVDEDDAPVLWPESRLVAEIRALIRKVSEGDQD